MLEEDIELYKKKKSLLFAALKQGIIFKITFKYILLLLLLLLIFFVYQRKNINYKK
jgi:uncharacterized membrane protein YbhN (UPF0104 family)